MNNGLFLTSTLRSLPVALLVGLAAAACSSTAPGDSAEQTRADGTAADGTAKAAETASSAAPTAQNAAAEAKAETTGEVAAPSSGTVQTQVDIGGILNGVRCIVQSAIGNEYHCRGGHAGWGRDRDGCCERSRECDGRDRRHCERGEYGWGYYGQDSCCRYEAPPPPPPPSYGGPCDDARPTGSEQYSCDEQRSWGKCNEDWMVNGGFCKYTCGHC